jgi:hypothetical protein
MSRESVYHVARSWVDVDSFHTRLFIVFMICTASVRNILDILSYTLYINTYSAFFSGGTQGYAYP